MPSDHLYNKFNDTLSEVLENLTNQSRDLWRSLNQIKLACCVACHEQARDYSVARGVQMFIDSLDLYALRPEMDSRSFDVCFFWLNEAIVLSDSHPKFKPNQVG